MVQGSLEDYYATTEMLYKMNSAEINENINHAHISCIFLDCARIAERLLFICWKVIYFAELLQTISEWAVLDRFMQKQSPGGVLEKRCS